MSDIKKPEFVNVVPVSGKFVEFIYKNTTYKVWRVHPSTPNKFGTPIPYDVALHYVSKRNPIISLVMGEKSPFLPEDLEIIKSNASGIVPKNLNSKDSVSSDNPELKKALDLLAKQGEENKALRSSLDGAAKAQEDLLKRLQALEKKSTAAGTSSSGAAGGVGAPAGSAS